MQVQVVESVLSDVSDTKSRVLLDLSLLRQCLTLYSARQSHQRRVLQTKDLTNADSRSTT